MWLPFLGRVLLVCGFVGRVSLVCGFFDMVLLVCGVEAWILLVVQRLLRSPPCQNKVQASISLMWTDRGGGYLRSHKIPESPDIWAMVTTPYVTGVIVVK